MSDYKAGTSLHQVIHGLLDQYLCPCIYRTCRLIQNQDLRICQNCPRDRQQLFLSLRHIVCFFIQFHIISARKCLHKLMHMSCLGCLDHFFIRCIQFSVFDIVPDTSIEQPGILQHHSEHLTQFTSVEIPDVMSVDLDGTAVHIVEPHQKLDHRRLSCSGRPYNCNFLPLFYFC